MCSTSQVSAHDLPATMRAVVLTAIGGPEVLEYRTDVPVPRPGLNEVLIAVGAAGVNNTDINTRVGWYDTADTPAGSSWSGEPIGFPRIQGADVCGRIVAVGAGVAVSRIGERVICASMQRAPAGDLPFVTTTMGSEFDGGFAEYVSVHAAEAHAVECDWTDVELGSIPCAASTAENALHRVGVDATDTVLILGASGGVGSAAVQLAHRRGATVVAVTGASKAAAVRALGADRLVERGADLVEVLGRDAVDVVVDLVGGPTWPTLLAVLRRGGRYVTAGAIAGPIVELDLRTLYLKDLTLCGATYQEAGVFERLVGYIERNEIRPVVHATYPLAEIASAQAAFLAKDFVGKLVLVP